MRITGPEKCDADPVLGVDDLVGRLRNNPERFGCMADDCPDCAVLDEAADRIEVLEGALREIVDNVHAGTPSWIGNIARAALKVV